MQPRKKTGYQPFEKEKKKYYKDAGGTYEGKKSKDNKLSKWSKEDWQTKEEYARLQKMTEQDFEELQARVREMRKA